MPKEILFLVEESPEGGYEAQAPGYSIYTQAETMDEMKQMVADAVRCHFDEAGYHAFCPALKGCHTQGDTQREPDQHQRGYRGISGDPKGTR